MTQIPATRPTALLAAAMFILSFTFLPASNSARGADESSETPDKVTVLLNDGGRISMPCRVIDYSGRSLRIRLKGGTFREYSPEQIVDIQTPESPPHQKGMEQYQRGELADAKASLEEALNLESRAWVRREILAQLIRCSLRKGDYATAGTRFLLLARSDPETRYFGLAPLVWGPYEQTAELRVTTRQWRDQQTEAARLLSASFSLQDSRYSAEAESDLKTLSSSGNRSIQALAQSQLWRLRLAKGEVTRDEVTRWQVRIQEMPEEIRGGPYYLAGLGFRQFREHDRAAAAFLWLPIAYSDDTHLAARACLDAADSLVKCGQKAQALTMYREAAQRFADTPFAQDATSALGSLTDEWVGH